jgi:ABC transporter with metal-binding/Fe-S-binding domain ATP-binding protein
MKLALLLSGGKDSVYAGYLAKTKFKHDVVCCISIISKNKESYMFHTPSISKVKFQAKLMKIPLITKETSGKKEIELKDLELAIETAKKKYKIEGVITGAIQSVYQASRIQKICNKLNLEVFNPLWQTDALTYLKDLIKNKFKVILTGVFAYPLNQSWLGKEINKEFIEDIKKLNEKYKISLIGEGGEFETFVLNCPLFKKELKIKSHKDIKEGENSWRRELELNSFKS